MKKLLLILGLSISTYSIQAQAIDAEPEVSTVCGGGSASLTATVIPAGSSGAPGSLPTTDYAISTIPFSTDPFTSGTAVALTDDSQTGLVIPIGFTFCYFGTEYTVANIGSNNWLSFSAAQSTTYTPQAIPSATNFPVNAILGPFQDINPGAGGTVLYATYGTAPFRRFVVSWNNVPMFSCTGQLYSSQIIIYETTNIIETHIANKSVCPGWVGGRATHGLQNTTGTVAIAVPGRNNTQWTASNEGTRFTPNGVATYTINWYILPANTLIGTGPSITVTPVTSPQYYYAEVVGPNGCNPTGSTANNTDTVVVFSSSLAVDAGPFTAICENTSTTLNAFAPGGISYTWSPVTGLSNPTIPNPIANPTTTTTYTVLVTDALGCSGIDTVTIAVNPAPFVDAGFGAGICLGDNIQLSGNGGGTFAWAPAASLDNATIGTPTATPTATTTYTLTVTDGIGCTSTDTATVFISNSTANAGPTVSICNGTSTTLNATGGATYTWSASASLSNLNIANPVANPTTTTTYTVTIDDAAGTGCISTDTVTVIVNNLPIADAGTSAAYCIGGSTVLNATGGGTYAWLPATGLSSTTTANPTANPTSTITYTVTITSAPGCTSTDTVTVTVNNLPIVDAGNNISICVGGSASLNAIGAQTFVWTPSSSLSNANIANPIATPTVVTTYTVVGTDASGCSATDSVNVSLNGITISATATPATICAGTTSNLSVTGATSYTWTPSGSLSNATIANPVANPTNTTTYTVIGSDAASGCADTTTVTLTVNSLPNVNAGATLLICAGATANLSATGAPNVTWTPTTSLNNPNIPNPTSTATATTLYTVVGTDVNGCTASDTVSVIVIPVPNANAGSNTSICNGSSTTLNATGGGTYSWLPSSGLSSTTIANPVANPTTTTTYTVTVTSNFCSATSQVTVTVNPAPIATASTNNASICAGTSVQLTATGGGNYSWSPSTGLSSTTIANPIASPTTTTTYTVIVSNVVGCSDTATVTINVTNAMSIGSSSITPETCGSTNGVITTGAITGGNSPYTYSLNGGSSQASATFSNLAAGTYTITVTDAGGCATTQTVTVGQVLGVNAAFSATPPSGVYPLNVNFNNSTTGATNYVWDFDNGLGSILTNPSTSYGQVGQYTVTLIAYNNNPACADTATFTIDVYDEVMLGIPNVFTPNGDGINDIFFVSANGVTEISGTIFNRWGKKVFEWKGAPSTSLGWDGKINGNKAEDGAYYYIIDAKGSDGKDYNEKGYLQLINGK